MKALIKNLVKKEFNTSILFQNFIAEMLKQEAEIFTTALRVMAEPPIKGEITKGKIKWRGIKLIRQLIGFSTYSWIEQRGKQISPKFNFEVNLPDVNES